MGGAEMRRRAQQHDVDGIDDPAVGVEADEAALLGHVDFIRECRVAAQARHLDFVEAARASGAGRLMIMRYHILNNVLGPILVYATSLISIGIILAAGLSFLGLGVTPPSAEWGLMLNNLRGALWVDPVIAAALAMTRRPDPAAELRAAETA